MKHLISPQGNVHAYEQDGTQDDLIKQAMADGFTEISDNALADLRTPTKQQQQDAIQAQRLAAYQREADPLFFKVQRGEATEAEYAAKIAEIKKRFPKP